MFNFLEKIWPRKKQPEVGKTEKAGEGRDPQSARFEYLENAQRRLETLQEKRKIVEARTDLLPDAKAQRLADVDVEIKGAEQSVESAKASVREVALEHYATEEEKKAYMEKMKERKERGE